MPNYQNRKQEENPDRPQGSGKNLLERAVEGGDDSGGSVESSHRLHSRRHIPRPPVGREDHDAANAFWWLMARRRSHTCAMRELSPGQPCDADFRARRRNQAASAFDIRVHRERDREEMQQQQLNPTPTFARAFNAQALIENLTTYADTY